MAAQLVLQRAQVVAAQREVVHEVARAVALLRIDGLQPRSQPPLVGEHVGTQRGQALGQRLPGAQLVVNVDRRCVCAHPP